MIRRLITAMKNMRLQRLDPEAVGPAVHSMDANGLLLGRGDETMLERMCATQLGRKLLAERHDILAIVSDRDTLREMPEGSLGRLYCRFAEENQLFPEQLAHEVRVARAASGGLVPNATPEVAYLHDRYRDLHDLWHVVTGYGTDMAGELSIVGFQTKQVGYRAMTILAAVQVFIIVCRTGRFDILKTWFGGRRRGKAAQYLLAADWERLLPLPLDEVRRELHVEPVGPYRIWNYPPPRHAAAQA
jgi:ubiquinone biosynthesis protein COQ4